MPRIRPVRPEDLDAVYAITLATGLAGEDATGHYADGRLLGHIYSAPYILLEPDLALVVEDVEGLAGYMVAAADSRQWAARLERDWWPALREHYPDPGPAPGGWTPDQRLCHLIHHPGGAPPEVVAAFPAHLHANLLPRLQGRGLGTRLFQAWLEIARPRGIGAAHVGVSRTNARGQGYWRSLGFADIDFPGRDRAGALWLGRPQGAIPGNPAFPEA